MIAACLQRPTGKIAIEQVVVVFGGFALRLPEEALPFLEPGRTSALPDKVPWKEEFASEIFSHKHSARFLLRRNTAATRRRQVGQSHGRSTGSGSCWSRALVNFPWHSRRGPAIKNL